MKSEPDLFKKYCHWCNTETWWVIIEPTKPVSEIKCIEHTLGFCA